MWMMQRYAPDKCVVSSGTVYTVRDFVQFSLEQVRLDSEKYVKCDERCLRAKEVGALIGDSSRARRNRLVSPCSIPELARIMVDSDIFALEAEEAQYIDSVSRIWREFPALKSIPRHD